MQKKNFKPKEDKAKHCLMRRAKISHFLARVYAGEEKKRKRRKKKEEEKKKSRFGNFLFMYGTLVWNISFGMESMEPIYGFVG